MELPAVAHGYRLLEASIITCRSNFSYMPHCCSAQSFRHEAISQSPQQANIDRASQALTLIVPPGVSKSFRALADYRVVPRTTLQHRKDGRQSIKEKAQRQQYLHPWEEKALLNL